MQLLRKAYLMLTSRVRLHLVGSKTENILRRAQIVHKSVMRPLPSGQKSPPQTIPGPPVRRTHCPDKAIHSIAQVLRNPFLPMGAPHPNHPALRFHSTPLSLDSGSASPLFPAKLKCSDCAPQADGPSLDPSRLHCPCPQGLELGLSCCRRSRLQKCL